MAGTPPTAQAAQGAAGPAADAKGGGSPVPAQEELQLLGALRCFAGHAQVSPFVTALPMTQALCLEEESSLCPARQQRCKRHNWNFEVGCYFFSLPWKFRD